MGDGVLNHNSERIAVTVTKNKKLLSKKHILKSGGNDAYMIHFQTYGG
jgi:hypothetical protein